MLLDEADVYAHKRGNDLTQNAIVGVFLRVLEYQSAVLFFTTNRAEDVDDAIASRCVARLNYEVPTKADQAKIWRILVDQSGAKMSDREIKRVVDANPTLTGRDVKNLLKLAMLTAKQNGITATDVEFVKQFKPTAAATGGPLVH
jgi:AAA+ superfamily predicted ATPase